MEFDAGALLIFSVQTAGLQVALTRHLHLPGISSIISKPPLQFSDTIATVQFRGTEYLVYPGTEGVAQLVIDVPKNARTVKGGERQADEDGSSMKAPLFEVRGYIDIKIVLPSGRSVAFSSLFFMRIH